MNLGITGATVSMALSAELPTALSLHPTLVTVWLNVDDLLSVVPASVYESELNTLVRALRGTGAVVLVGNTPPLDHLPAYLACLDPAHHPGGCSQYVPQPVPGPQVVDAFVDAYNAATARVAASNGAVLVDLHAAGLRAEAQGREASLVSADGFHLNAAGYQLVANAFAAALPRPPGSPPTTVGGAG